MACLAFGANADDLNVNGSMRSMIVHAPADLPEGRPLVISLHGFNQGAAYQHENTGWDNCADTAKFVVVYPQGNGSAWDLSGDGDINFMKAIMDEMDRRYKIDRNRIYISGFSMGGMMTYFCMQKLSDIVAAFGPVSGFPVDNRAPMVYGERRAPFIHIHGTGDDVVKWGGDPNHAAGGYPPVTDYVKRWVEYLGFDKNNPKVGAPTTSPNNQKDKMYLWEKADSDLKVAFVTIDGAGHWHSDGQQWGGANSTAELWRFMSKYSLAKYTCKVSASNSVIAVGGNIELSGTVNGKTDDIANITYYARNEKIETVGTQPFSMVWTPEKTGEYLVTAEAQTKDGEKVKSAGVRIVVAEPNKPFSGKAQTIPGIIEAENYDEGVEGLAYFDMSEGNNCDEKEDVYRTDDVDIKQVGDAYILGNCQEGEWIKYTVNVTQSGEYKMTVRVGEGNENGGKFSIKMDDGSIDHTINVAYTGEWGTMEEQVQEKTFNLKAGTHEMTITIDADWVDIDWVKFEAKAKIKTVNNTTKVLTISPNPASDRITISSANGFMEAVIVNMLGVEVMRSNETTLNISGLPDGAYILKVKSADGETVKRVVKRK